MCMCICIRNIIINIYICINMPVWAIFRLYQLLLTVEKSFYNQKRKAKMEKVVDVCPKWPKQDQQWPKSGLKWPKNKTVAKKNIIYKSAQLRAQENLAEKYAEMHKMGKYMAQTHFFFGYLGSICVGEMFQIW